MAAYGALVFVMHIVEQIQSHPLRPPISLDKKLAQSLTDNVTFLQDYLENDSSVDNEEADALECRIADAAYAAEDIIESHIVDQKENINSIDFYKSMQKVIGVLESIKRDVAETKEKTVKIQDDDYQLLHRNPMPAAAAASMGQNSTTVGLDDILIQVMDKLTGQQSNRQIIPIVGMGGIGKTTLARNIYVNPLIVQYFDFRGWATISQEFNSKEILLEVLACLNITGVFGQMSKQELGDKLYKSLFGPRYLIVMDDIWSIEAWDEVKTFFPDNCSDGSAIVLTTRLSNLASQLSGSDDALNMSFLDEDKSWNLFCNTVFGEEGGCPIELEEIGKEVVKSCKGLPLSIAVIGGMLSRHKQTPEYWEHILENLNPILNSEDNEHCLKILRMSYKVLPVHLKPCFLYMGVFPEDSVIDVSKLIKLWVAEGFLKPIGGKSLEVVAEEYLKDLVDRNLILVYNMGYKGEIDNCKIHDLLRDLCLKESQKGKFLCIKRPHDLKSSHDFQNLRRVGFHQNTRNEPYGTSQPASLRSLVCYFGDGTRYLPFLGCRLLRVLMAPDKLSYNQGNYSPETIFQQLNLRFLEIVFNDIYEVPSQLDQFWNLHTLHVINGIRGDVAAPIEIWKMPQLRHVIIERLKLPDIPPMDDVVLRNLQTLENVKNFKCGEKVVKRIPNIKKLGIYYEDDGDYCLDNLCRLRALELLSCDFGYSLNDQSQSCLLPYLSELTLVGTRLHWDDVIMTKVGTLPCLQVLKLISFTGSEWETVDGQFGSLKCLQISSCWGLEYWRTESTHFPCLEHLVLRGLYNLKDIPLEIGHILTMKSIELKICSEPAIISAKKIREEQVELGNVGLQVIVHGDRG
ncbi:putative late blight resistance protein homolog r1a-6 [Phtheirospermum japonicum]|uniref:Putative late blight resistance protein homolog r1a-6 n=1 Tax=Phtheirospermum japonicum TaxID=374723 RepID=A0A830BWQ9_9LAMI|nr:putative late blight resistance protein homolog r1a-6 [Phtheirospermum japonicum]